MAETEKTKNVIEKSIFNWHETKKPNTFIEKIKRPVTKKTKTFIEKSIFNSPETQKTWTLIENTIRVLKRLQIQMKKWHSTVFHNA